MLIGTRGRLTAVRREGERPPSDMAPHPIAVSGIFGLS
jgi:hypothetical protein